MSLASANTRAPEDCDDCENVAFFGEFKNDPFGKEYADEEADYEIGDNFEYDYADDGYDEEEEYRNAPISAPAAPAVAPMASLAAPAGFVEAVKEHPLAKDVHEYTKHDCTVCGGYTTTRNGEVYKLEHNPACAFKDGVHDESKLKTEEPAAIGLPALQRPIFDFAAANRYLTTPVACHNNGRLHHQRGTCGGDKTKKYTIKKCQPQKEEKTAKKCYKDEVYEVFIDDMDEVCSQIASACKDQRAYKAKFSRIAKSADGSVQQRIVVQASVKPKKNSLMAIDVNLVPVLRGVEMHAESVQSRVFKIDASNPSRMRAKVLAKGIETFRDKKIASPYVHAALLPIENALKRVCEMTH